MIEKKNLALIWVIVLIIQTVSYVLLMKHAFNLGIEPLNFSYQILLAATIYLLIYALIKEPKALVRVDKKSFLTIVVTGIIGGAVAYGFSFSGLEQSTAINYSFLSQITIFFTPVLAFFFLREHLKLYKTILLFLLPLGAYLVSTNGELIIPNTGDIYILLGAVAVSVSVILTKTILKKVPTLTFSMYRALFGGLSLLLFLVLIEKVILEFNWYWIAGVGFIIATGIYAMNKALEYASVSYMQMMYMSAPVVTALFASLLLDETMTPIQMVGGVLVIGSGVFVHKLKI